ncbi:tripartite tricarboxylate transporter TctB family protein [Marinobacter sp. BSs20148]|jgi:hypothetical protein|uniref:tripartite tricarboxylate transporter TctB family protein n=1 Tax=Marinobacter sp. BSs20148 TaxID=490759 RepID=UPI0002776880|nr:tripartite tricarboxylate transporter TctB family protein [Marinobacter sp. BSs20148]AFP30224.1 hypothetical protein MRBBS_1286 [Marinobacter sp. BSs20148]
MISRAFKPSLVTLGLLFVFGYVVLEAVGQPIQAKLFPMTVGIIGFVLVAIQFGRELWTAWRACEGSLAENTDPQEGATDFAITDIEKTSIGRLRAAEQFGWLAGLLGGLFLLGFYISVPLMVCLYLLRHRERPRLIIIMTVGVALVVWGVFNQLLNLPFPQGLILEWLDL